MLEALFAGGWGVIAASTLVLGAVVGVLWKVPEPLVAGVMAFGAGGLVSTLAFELVLEAHATGGLVPTLAGFLTGAATYVVADLLLAQRGARQRKRSIAVQHHAQSAVQRDISGGSAAAVGFVVAVGALLDGIPESLVLGLSLAQGGGVSIPFLVAVAVSNLPEGLASAAGMRHAGRSVRSVLSLWVGIALVSGVAAMIGYLLLAGTAPEVIAIVTAVAAGGVLAMVSNTMIPEAFAADRSFTGLWAAMGFALAFALHQAG